MSRLRRRIVLGLSAVTALALVSAAPAVADKGWHGKPPGDLPKVPLMVGSGGAVSSVDRDASQIGIDVLSDDGPNPFLLDNRVASDAVGRRLCRELETR